MDLYCTDTALLHNGRQGSKDDLSDLSDLSDMRHTSGKLELEDMARVFVTQVPSTYGKISMIPLKFRAGCSLSLLSLSKKKKRAR